MTESGGNKQPSLVRAPTSLALLVGLPASILLLAVAVSAVVGARYSGPDDPAIFATAIIASSSSAVNIVLTFFVLLNTQAQLRTILQNSAAERDEAGQQLELARSQLAAARDQVEKAEHEANEAREIALRSNRENVRARLDASAPRVTFERTSDQLLFKPKGLESTTEIPSIAELETSDGLLIVNAVFDIHNWGDEPVALMLPTAAWKTEYNYHQTLPPGQSFSGALVREFAIPLWNDGLRRHAKEGWRRAEPPDSPWYWSIDVVVANVDATVQDTLTWGGSVHLFHMTENGRIVESSGPRVNDVPMAHRKRTYTHLAEGAN